jgi:hypothetical protein
LVSDSAIEVNTILESVETLAGDLNNIEENVKRVFSNYVVKTISLNKGE